MKYAILSDIHSNYVALKAVLYDLPDDIDGIWSLGDVVGYGGQPVECVEYISKNAELSLMGNHEAMIITGIDAEAHVRPDVRLSNLWTRAVLTEKPDLLQYLSRMPRQDEDSLYGINLRHGGYPDPLFTYTRGREDALRAFGCMGSEDVLFVGHTHCPIFFTLSEGERVISHPGRGSYSVDAEESGPMIINVGSVGQPRDRVPEASYVIYDNEEEAVIFHRVWYDIAAAQDAIIAAGLPIFFAERLERGE